MRVKCLDKRLRSFMGYSVLLVAVIGAVAVLLSYIYHFFTIDVYNRIIAVLIILSFIIMAAVLVAMVSIFSAVKRKKGGMALLPPVRLGLKLVMPFALFVTDLFKKDKDMIRGLFIEINNIFVQSANIRKSPDKAIVLLPHCLQNSECTYKVTGDIKNCRMCGRCTIGGIRKMTEERGVRAFIVTGVTAARNLIAKLKPEIVLSVACERDLAIGISDVSKIPVLGVVNKRPNGPCVNTTVDLGQLRDKLDRILEQGAEAADLNKTNGSTACTDEMDESEAQTGEKAAAGPGQTDVLDGSSTVHKNGRNRTGTFGI
jgi:hypothetical protein